MTDFRLSDSFVEKYVKRQPNWGPLGYFTYKTKYARPVKGENRTEEWWETVRRVVEGCYSIQRGHCETLRLPWNHHKAQKSAQEMYDLMWNMKFLPPGRGLWAMGTETIAKKGAAPLYNCAFISTSDLSTQYAEPFCFLMDMSMLGVGVGFDTRGSKSVTIKRPRQGNFTFKVEDSREGWVEITRTIIDAYFGRGSLPSNIDYTNVRPYGEPIKIFGGTASGPDPLKQLIEKDIHSILQPLIDFPITSEAIVDLFNAIGRCVVSGNVRRSASIALGDPEDEEFLALQDPSVSEKHALLCGKDGWRWASNNSVFATIGMDYSKPAIYTKKNGQIGYFWLETARKYGRMIDPPHLKIDEKIMGCNPCQPGWATVLTPNGIRPLSAINKGDKIWSGTKFTKVIDKWSTGIKPVYGYHTRGGIFFGTENHRILSHGEKIEVDESDTIDTCTGPYPSDIKSIASDLNSIIDGLVIGDGSIHRASNNLVGLHIGENDQDYFKDSIARKILKHRPGIKEGFYEIETSIKWYELPRAYERKVPDRYIQGNISAKLGFLRGLYSANGSIVRNRITLKSASLNLIQDVQIMLSSVGIKSYYTVNQSHITQFKNGDYQCRESYDLNITTDRHKFKDLVGFIQLYKKEKLRSICQETNSSKQKLSYEIISKEYISEEEVFDITVEDESHTYWTGGLLVSNCGEISLESYEFCNVPETFPSQHSTFEEYKRTLKFAYLYAKTVTLIPTHNARVNAVQLRNRKIGLSMSGVIQSIYKHGIRTHFNWCDNGYKYLRELDEIYSDWLCIPLSKKITSGKPSGTISLLPGVTPGVHFPISEYYWRTQRHDISSPFVKALRDAGYRIEEGEGHNTAIVYFPVKEENYWKSKSDVTIWEQLEIAAQMQAYWSDNQISITVTFKPEEADQIETALQMYEDKLKSVSFLPLLTLEQMQKLGYEHPPYQAMTKEEYEEAITNLKSIKLKRIAETQGFDKTFCDSDHCILPDEHQEQV